MNNASWLLMKGTGRPLLTLLLLVLVAAASLTRYTVRRGDTLSGIASKRHVSVASLAHRNAIADPDRIFAGQQLTIGEGTSGTASGPYHADPAPSGFVLVRPGDTLTSLARRAGVAPGLLAAANGLVGGAVYAGARYLVPARPATTSFFTVAGSWRCPVAGHRSFMNDWAFARETGTFHEGNDIMAKKGTPVVAPVAGTVVRDPNGRGGNAFWLHGRDGIAYYGAHLSKYGHTGKVAAGTVIGYVGNTGDASGGPTHLHFEIHPGNGPAVNPYPILLARCA